MTDISHLYVVSYIGNSKSGRGDFCADVSLSEKWGPGTTTKTIKALEDEEELINVVITSIFYAGAFEKEAQ